MYFPTTEGNKKSSLVQWRFSTDFLLGNIRLTNKSNVMNIYRFANSIRIQLCFAQFVSSEYFKDNGLNHNK